MKLASSGPSTESFGEGGSPRSEEGGASLSPDADAPFRSAAVAEKLRQHHLWHGDLLAGGGAFAPFRAWLEARLPAVTQTTAGYFTAALAAVNRTTDEALAPDTLQYATCLWTRDVSNVALALYVAGDVASAAKAAAALGALYSREDHASCMEAIIASGGVGYEDAWLAPVRFRVDSGDRTDPWAHSQLDALGLFLTVYGTLCCGGALVADVSLVDRFVRYLAAIDYTTRPDLGHWEEWPAAVRTSSLGCVVAGLRAVSPLLPPESAPFCEALAERGAAVLAPRLGGPGSPAWEAESRRDDAAVLTLLLPPVAAQLRLTQHQRDALAGVGLRLRRPHGVLRYTGDSYYGADYQQRLRAWKDASAGGDPTAYPSPSMRDSWAVAGCEAQWTIFEPIVLLHFLHSHAQAPTPATAAAVRRCLMRVLAAIEEEPGSEAGWGSGGGGGDAAEAVPPPNADAAAAAEHANGGAAHATGDAGAAGGGGGDAAAAAAAVEAQRAAASREGSGRWACAGPRLHVHESYAVVCGSRRPNDVQDLLWAVAYVRMALAALAEALDDAAAPFV